MHAQSVALQQWRKYPGGARTNRTWVTPFYFRTRDFNIDNMIEIPLFGSGHTVIQ